jgi:L-seryl-tRNA(Ser) seleniumtransferase
VRADKTALAGVAATLRHYLRNDYTETIPIWRMIAAGVDDLENRCRSWLERAGGQATLEIVESTATVGGGSLPGETLPSRAIALDERASASLGLTLDEVARRLRSGRPALMPHVEHGRLLIDARTVLPDQDDALIECLIRALAPA